MDPDTGVLYGSPESIHQLSFPAIYVYVAPS